MDEFDDYGKRKRISMYILFGFVLFFLITILFLAFNKGIFDSKNYLIVGNHLIFNKTRDGYIQVKPNDIVNMGFNVYNDNQKVEADSVKYSSGKFDFYNGKKLVSNDDFRFAYSGFPNLKYVDFSIMDYDSDDEAFVLKVANTDDESDYELFRNSLRKVSLDFDSDGNEESIYVMTDYMFGNGYRTPYSYMFSTRDNNVLDSIFEIDNNVYQIDEVLDIDGDGVYEIIVSKGALLNEDFDSCYQIYNLIKGNISLVRDCK